MISRPAGRPDHYIDSHFSCESKTQDIKFKTTHLADIARIFLLNVAVYFKRLFQTSLR